MKTPKFWYDTTSKTAQMQAMALSAFSGAYALGHMAHRMVARPQKMNIPVICIGNLVAGGGGKTPVAMAMLSLIRDRGLAKNPCFLTRGYGGALAGPVMVDNHHTAQQIGDEPLLLHRVGPVVVAHDRRAGISMAQLSGHDMIVMDDGLHNPSIVKDMSIVVIDGLRGFGNQCVIPAGPMRTSLSAGLRMADVFIIIGDDRHNVAALLPRDRPVIGATLKATLPGRRHDGYLAFCGIANPEKFKDSLRSAGIAPAALIEFPDHHAYRAGDIETLRKTAETKGLRLITTAKDAVKLTGFISSGDFDTLEIDLEWPAESVATLIQRMIHR